MLCRHADSYILFHCKSQYSRNYTDRLILIQITEFQSGFSLELAIGQNRNKMFVWWVNERLYSPNCECSFFTFFYLFSFCVWQYKLHSYSDYLRSRWATMVLVNTINFIRRSDLQHLYLITHNILHFAAIFLQHSMNCERSSVWKTKLRNQV